MFAIIGILVVIGAIVIGAIVGGYLMQHGNVMVLVQPAELPWRPTCPRPTKPRAFLPLPESCHRGFCPWRLADSVDRIRSPHHTCGSAAHVSGEESRLQAQGR